MIHTPESSTSGSEDPLSGASRHWHRKSNAAAAGTTREKQAQIRGYCRVAARAGPVWIHAGVRVNTLAGRVATGDGTWRYDWVRHTRGASAARAKAQMALGVEPLANESQQVFDELLATVSSRPHARELFQRLIAAIGRIVPYDEAQLVVLQDGGPLFLRQHTRDGGSDGVARKSAATPCRRINRVVRRTLDVSLCSNTCILHGLSRTDCGTWSPPERRLYCWLWQDRSQPRAVVRGLENGWHPTRPGVR